MLSLSLAMSLCELLTQSTAKLGQIKAQYDDSRKAAIRIDAIENPPQPVQDDAWVLSFSSGFGGF
jgi:hypothetical protein